MKVVYAQEPPPAHFKKSIFLAGPSPRTADASSWRPGALNLLQQLGYDGVVFVPEARGWKQRSNYDGQVAWEKLCLSMSDCIFFWVPRDMTTLPALTTNIEFGMCHKLGNVVFAAPPQAPSINYLVKCAQEEMLPVAATLGDGLAAAIAMVGNGAFRGDGERYIPLNLWRTPSFQEWYAALQTAGNTLERSWVKWLFRVGPQKNIILFWALHAEIYIRAERRSKVNEVVVGQPSISSTVLYHRTGKDIGDTDIVLVREFRSPGSNRLGYVHELPGGSSIKPNRDPRDVAAEECRQETGISIAPRRFRMHETRQVMATASTHRSHLCSAELTAEEIARLRAVAGKPFGVAKDSERTYVEVMKLGDILADNLVDWSMIGMIMSVISSISR